MRDCELCESPARMYCESDQAILCWGCDAKVHSANFLVARHSRNLLCHICQSPTPWKASGSKLGPTISVCDRCTTTTTTTPFNHPPPPPKITSHHQQHHPEEDDDEIDDDDAQVDDFDTQDDDFDDDDDDDDDDEDDEEEEEDEEDGENQVVPWSSAPPPIPSSSSSDESSIRFGSASSPLKRTRENADFCSYQDDLGCSSSNQRASSSSIEEESMCFGSFSTLNDTKKKVTVSVRSEWRFRREEEEEEEEEKVCKDQTAVDLVCTAYRSR